MSIKRVRGCALFLIIAALSVGVTFNIMTADKKTERLDAVMVMLAID